MEKNPLNGQIGTTRPDDVTEAETVDVIEDVLESLDFASRTRRITAASD